MRVLNAKLNVDAKKSSKGTTYFVYSVSVPDKDGKTAVLIPIPMDAINPTTSKQIVALASTIGVHEKETTIDVDVTTW